MNAAYRISHLNIDDSKFLDSQDVNLFLLDTIYTCNLHCLYCHNRRHKEKLSLSQLQSFLDKKIRHVNMFQIGCAMEPTMDNRLLSFAKLIQQSHAKPKNSFRLQTNGTLLHKHDIPALLDVGLNNFHISFDSTDELVHKTLRGGSDLKIIKSNIEHLASNHPQAKIIFVCTVNKLNLDGLNDLCKYAVFNNIQSINFRKMFYFPNSQIIKEHDTMANIALSNDEFLLKMKEIKDAYSKSLNIIYQDDAQHEKRRKEVIS